MFPDFRNRKLREDSGRSVSVWLAAASRFAVGLGRSVAMADLHHGRFDLAGAAGRAPTLPGVEHHWVDVQTGSGPVRLHLAATGSGLAGALLHGWPQHWWCWRRVVKQLRDYRLLIPDLRGFGWSEAPGSGYSPTGFADDAVALLDALDIARAHVIGHDWGGFAGFPTRAASF